MFRMMHERITLLSDIRSESDVDPFLQGIKYWVTGLGTDLHYLLSKPVNSKVDISQWKVL